MRSGEKKLYKFYYLGYKKNYIICHSKLFKEPYNKSYEKTLNLAKKNIS